MLSKDVTPLTENTATSRHGGSALPVAILCSAVTKQFPVLDEGASWRILFGQAARGTAITALHGVSLRVPKGQLVGVLGRNGAGKSTLLRVLAGVYAPTRGSVWVGGEVGSLFELGGLGNRFITGREYAQRVLRLQGVAGDRLVALVADVEQFSELESFFDRRIHTYSGGMAARLYFAVATALRQDVYLIDEILSVGDEHFQAKCWRRLRERLTNGASGVLVTHDWSAVIKLCENSHVLDGGIFVLSGPSDRIVVEYLHIPRPDGSTASFVNVPETLEASSREDWTAPIDVDVKQPGEIEFAFSIEILRRGLGWEILLLSDFHPVASSAGRFRIKLKVPQLPLAPGRYSLNLFLRARVNARSDVITCDTRSWTLGNGLTLAVAGAPCKSITRLPLRWSTRIPSDAHD